MSRGPRRLIAAGIVCALVGTLATDTGLRGTAAVHAYYWVFAILVPVGVLLGVAGSAWHLVRGRPRVPRRLADAAGWSAMALAAALWPALAMGPARSIDVEGTRRAYLVHEPEGADDVDDGGDHAAGEAGRAADARPAVLVLHGFMQTPRGMRNLTGIERLADERGFVVVYPKGTLRSWNDGDDTKPASTRGVDDGAFLEALLDSLPARHGVDPARVYAIGFSNGGYLLVRHACELAGRIAAFGIVAAGTYPVWEPDCRPAAPPHAAFILGAADPTVEPLDARFEVSPGVSAELWMEAYGCPDPETVMAPDDVGPAAVRHTTRTCPDLEVHQVVIDGAGHAWPGGPRFLPPFLVGEGTDAFDATAWLWAFFRRIGDRRGPPGGERAASAGGSSGTR